MDDVEQVLRDELSSRYPVVDQLVKHGFRLGGKRMRPALLILSGKACGGLSRDHVPLAAATELIHTATLIHDDVLDEAALRRHRDTVNARWDNEASILLGDYLLARAICLASSVDDPFACRAIGQAAKSMCEGELRQVIGRGNYALAEQDYLDIIAGKTAALCACCCRLGAYYAGAAVEQQEALSRFGQSLGVAFQIADDLLDLLGDEATTGKSLGSDLAKQKSTLPLIRMLSQLSAGGRDEVMRILAGSDNHYAAALEPWFERTDAVSYTRTKAGEFVRQAASELAVLPPNAARDQLARLTEFVVNRRH
ncbi:MAG: polyprenyl synthetase family protein [Pirellulales bacterium]|nr:polyprenyl synthetase family protein [Pirellulales bacterium]